MSFVVVNTTKDKYFTLDPFGIAVSSTNRQRMLRATKRTEIAYKKSTNIQSLKKDLKCLLCFTLTGISKV